MRVKPCGCVLLLGLSLIGPSTLTGCNQTSGYVMNESGKGYYAQGNYTAARREFERALMDSPENASYAFNVASAMRKQGDLIGAERMYQHALKLDPRHQPAHHEIATLLRDQGRYDEADSHIEEWAATQPYLPEALVEQAWMQRERGDLASAEQSLQAALRQKPNHARAMALLGQVYQETGRTAEAHGMYQRSLSLNPFQPEARAQFASMRGGAGPHRAAYAPPGYSLGGDAGPMMSYQTHHQQGFPMNGQMSYQEPRMSSMHSSHEMHSPMMTTSTAPHSQMEGPVFPQPAGNAMTLAPVIHQAGYVEHSMSPSPSQTAPPLMQAPSASHAWTHMPQHTRSMPMHPAPMPGTGGQFNSGPMPVTMSSTPIVSPF